MLKTKHTFMDDAERLLLDVVRDNRKLVLLREDIPLEMKDNILLDTILVSIPDEKNDSDESERIVLEVRVDQLAYMRFMHGDILWLEVVPFGDGWIPIEQLENISRFLVDI